MGNSILNNLGGQPNAQNAQLLQQFNQFKQTVKGDPRQLVMQMVQSGQVSQEQLNQAMQMARQLGFMRG